MCLRALPFLIQSGWGTAVLLSFRNEECLDTFFFFNFYLRFNLDLIWLNQTPVMAAFQLWFLRSIPHIHGNGIEGWYSTSYFWPQEPEKDSCLELFSLYLVACNYASTPPFTTFTTSRLLSGLRRSAENSRAADAPAMLSATHEKCL